MNPKTKKLTLLDAMKEDVAMKNVENDRELFYYGEDKSFLVIYRFTETYYRGRSESKAVAALLGKDK